MKNPRIEKTGMKKPVIKRRSIIFSRVVISSVLTLALLGFALAEPRITEEGSVTPSHALTDAEAKSVSHAAGRLLWHVNMARQELNQVITSESSEDPAEAYASLDVAKTTEEAGRHVTQALTLSRIIKNTLPVYNFKTTITAGEETYSEEQQLQPMFVPIYSELDVIDVLRPVIAAKYEAAGATAAGAPATLFDTRLAYTRAMLDVDAAMRYLAAADTNIKAANFAQAGRDLSLIQQNVIVSSIDTDVPLVTARVDLYQAQRAMQNDNPDIATANLTAAYDALGRYHGMLLMGSERAREVQTLRNEIMTLNGNLSETLKAQKETAVAKVDGWWHELRQWME